jgi:glycosyltransferase involved in cell wall biosynthesis
VFEYANALAARGWTPHITYPYIPLGESVPRLTRSPLISMRRRAGHAWRSLRESHDPAPWFHLDPRVQSHWAFSLESPDVPGADAVVATWWETAEYVARLPASKGKKFYLIQHLETWGGPEGRVMDTWKLPLHKIVIAKWLESIATGLGEKSTYIPNGLDFDAFGLDVPPERRPRGGVFMLYHTSDWKGSRDGLRAAEMARQRVPDLQLHMFGTPPVPPGLPAWVCYHHNPPQAELRALYNQAAIFVAPSWAEGWPLPPAEAMQCGCALVATDIGGHREYAIDGKTALLAPAKKPEALAECIVRLATDTSLAVAIANSGNEFIKQFTWNRAADAFENVLRAAL